MFATYFALPEWMRYDFFEGNDSSANDVVMSSRVILRSTFRCFHADNISKNLKFDHLPSEFVVDKLVDKM